MDIINNSEHEEIVCKLKKQLTKNYNEKVKVKVFTHKMSQINKIAKRTDYQYLLSLTFISKEKKNAKLAEEQIAK